MTPGKTAAATGPTKNTPSASRAPKRSTQANKAAPRQKTRPAAKAAGEKPATEQADPTRAAMTQPVDAAPRSEQPSPIQARAQRERLRQRLVRQYH